MYILYVKDTYWKHVQISFFFSKDANFHTGLSILGVIHEVFLIACLNPSCVVTENIHTPSQGIGNSSKKKKGGGGGGQGS